MVKKSSILRSNLTSVTVCGAFLQHQRGNMASLLAPKRKNEFASAIAARTKVTEAALMAHDLSRLKAIWEVVKPNKIEGVPASPELEEEGLGRPEGDLQWDDSSGHGVPGRQALEQVGEGKADIGDLDVGRAGQRVDRPATGLQRVVRGVTAMRKLWNSTHDPVQSPDSRRILWMHEVSPLPNHSSSELQWPPDRKSSEGVDCKEGSGSPDHREGEGQGRHQPVPPSGTDSKGGREAYGRSSHLLGRIVDEDERHGDPRHLFRRRGQVQRELDQGRDERDPDAPQRQGRWEEGGQERDRAGGQEVREMSARQPQASTDSPEDPDGDSAAGTKVPLSADEISERIAHGKRKRNRLKKGMARRLLGNAKSLALLQLGQQHNAFLILLR